MTNRVRTFRATIRQMAALSATSLEVVGHYAAAREAATNGKFEEALASYRKPVGLDPKPRQWLPGRYGQCFAEQLRNLQDAEIPAEEALRYLDNTIGARERYTITRGASGLPDGRLSTMRERNLQRANARYPAGRCGLQQPGAVSLSYLRRMPEALNVRCGAW